MKSEIYWLHKHENDSQLGIMARPRGDDWLRTEIENLRKENVSTLVSLLESAEIVELGLAQESRLCNEYEIEFINFPIKDRQVPASTIETDKLVSGLLDRIRAGRKVVIHCRMGIGRSSLIAALILIKTGYEADNVFDHISKIRRLRVPDTEEQIKWVRLQR